MFRRKMDTASVQYPLCLGYLRSWAGSFGQPGDFCFDLGREPKPLAANLEMRETAVQLRLEPDASRRGSQKRQPLEVADLKAGEALLGVEGDTDLYGAAFSLDEIN
jgi:hypothetical protein